MANTKTKTLNKTIVCRILRGNYKDFWKDVFVVDDYCYFTNGKQMVRCLSSLLDLSNTDIRKMDIRNYDDKGKQTIKDMIKIFDTAIENIKKAKYDDGCYIFDSRYWINRPLFKATVSATRKKAKEMDFGIAGKAAPISVLFRKTVVNAKYLLDLVELNKKKLLTFMLTIVSL